MGTAPQRMRRATGIGNRTDGTAFRGAARGCNLRVSCTACRRPSSGDAPVVCPEPDPLVTALSNRARMLAGDRYNTRDPELLALAHRARALLAAYASTPSTDGAARLRLLRELLGAVGEGVWIEPPFFCDYGPSVSIGAETFVNTNCVFLDAAPITIGRDVLIGPGVQLLTVSHPLRAAERIVPAAQRTAADAPYHTFARPITIGDGAWIGAGAIVLPGVTIGAGAVVGAGSLVTQDVPPHTLAFGQPCRVQRRLDGAEGEAPSVSV